MVGKVALLAGLTFLHTRLSLPSMGQNVASLIFSEENRSPFVPFQIRAVYSGPNNCLNGKKVHGSAFRLHGTRGTVQFF